MRCLAVLLLLPLAVLAQTFEVASVKLADPKAILPNVASDAIASLRGGPGSTEPTRIVYSNVTLLNLLITAYGADCQVKSTACDQVMGPAWITSERYDVEAKLPAGTTPDQFRQMLQNLLTERFHVRLHHETRELRGYELVVRKSPKLTRSPENAAEVPSGPLAEIGSDGYPHLLRAGILIAPLRGVTSLAEHLIAREQSMADLAAMLRNLMRAHVVDKTGIAGKYDFTLDFVPEGARFQENPDILLPETLPAAVDQLGLKLTSAKLPMKIVVVDSADRIPTAN